MNFKNQTRIQKYIAWRIAAVLLLSGLCLPVIKTEQAMQKHIHTAAFVYTADDSLHAMQQLSGTLSERLRVLGEQYRQTTEQQLRTQLCRHLCLCLSTVVFLRFFSIFQALEKADNPALLRHTGILIYIHNTDGKKRISNPISELKY